MQDKIDKVEWDNMRQSSGKIVKKFVEISMRGDSLRDPKNSLVSIIQVLGHSRRNLPVHGAQHISRLGRLQALLSKRHRSLVIKFLLGAHVISRRLDFFYVVVGN